MWFVYCMLQLGCPCLKRSADVIQSRLWWWPPWSEYSWLSDNQRRTVRETSAQREGAGLSRHAVKQAGTEAMQSPEGLAYSPVSLGKGWVWLFLVAITTGRSPILFGKNIQSPTAAGLKATLSWFWALATSCPGHGALRGCPYCPLTAREQWEWQRAGASEKLSSLV